MTRVTITVHHEGATTTVERSYLRPGGGRVFVLPILAAAFKAAAAPYADEIPLLKSAWDAIAAFFGGILPEDFS